MGVVTARLDARDLGSVMKEIQQKLKGISLPSSYQIVYGGSYAEQQKSFSDLLKILIISGLLVFLIVLFMFKSLRISAIVIFISSLGIAGGVACIIPYRHATECRQLYGIDNDSRYHRRKLNIYNSAVSYGAEKFRCKGSPGVCNFWHVCVRAMTAVERLSLSHHWRLESEWARNMHQPLAIAVIGGLIMALPLLLIILPGLLKLFIKKT